MTPYLPQDAIVERGNQTVYFFHFYLSWVSEYPIISIVYTLTSYN